jgi:hypothetical protein
MPSRFLRLTLIAILPTLSACFINLQQDRLPVALLNEPYQESFDIDRNGTFWSSYFTTADGGDLPAGIGVSSNAWIMGSATELGHFEFHISLYSYESGFFNDFDGGHDDGEWFTLFVTEPSTNEACPSPQNENIQEVYVCAGSLSQETIENGDEFSLDIEYFANWFDSMDYDITAINFTIGFDAASVTPISDELNSTLLREVATHFGSTVAFDSTIPGQLNVVVTASTEQLRIPGRLMNIPFEAIADLPAGDYPFTIIMNGITQGEASKSTPTLLGVDGLITAEEDVPVVVEEPVTDTSTDDVAL